MLLNAHSASSRGITCDWIQRVSVRVDPHINSGFHLSYIIDFKFRDKKRAHGFYSSVTYKLNNTVKKKYIPAGLSSYYSLFLKSVTYRENCYSCPYANNSRVGDITIGDYWGIEKQHSDYLVSNGDF